jgi:hypothetical protein
MSQEMTQMNKSNIHRAKVVGEKFDLRMVEISDINLDYLDGEFKDAISLSMLRRDFDEIHGDPEFLAKHDRKVHTS